MGGEAGTGEPPVVPTTCGNPRITELFDFSDSAYVVNTSSGAVSLKWIKSAYDSTDTATGKIDATAVPPNNAKNLANMSILDVTFNNGDPAPAMRYTIPFSPTAPEPEAVQLIDIFAAYGRPNDAVDFSKAIVKAALKLASAPNTDCVVTANAWTTGTDAGTGTQYNHVDGPKAALSTDKWVNVQMDLSKSNPPNTVNQYGFSLHSSCSGQGGAGGTGNEAGGPTVVLIDNIGTVCQ